MLPRDPRLLAASRTQLAFVDYWMEKLEAEREERWWARFEQAMGLRFKRDDILKAVESGNEDRDEIFIPMSLAVSAATTGIMKGGIVGLLKEFWGVEGEVSGEPAEEIGPSPEIMRALKMQPLDPKDRAQLKKVVNMSDPRATTKEEMFEKFPLLKVRGGKPRPVKKRANPRGDKPPGML